MYSTCTSVFSIDCQEHVWSATLAHVVIFDAVDSLHNVLVGCTPLILAATAGHASTVEILLDHGADIEAQSDRTKDTALSLACSGGRQEVSIVAIIANILFCLCYFSSHYDLISEWNLHRC